MAKRIFISFLGTGRYTPCWYTVNGKKLTEEPVRFVQEAMVRHFCMNESSPWTAEDRILIFCTHYSDINKKDGAKETNWCDNNRFSEYGLEHFLKGMAEQGLQPQVEMVEIPSGFNEQEVWGIFSTVYDKLKEVLTDAETGMRIKGEIYFDVTHAFRSIPLFSLVLFNHTKVLLGAQLKAIKYGAFEAAPDIIDPSTGKPSAEPKVAPILDLTSIARLQTYNQLANDFKEFGKIKNLGQELKSLKGLPNDAIEYLNLAINSLHEYITTSSLKKLKAGEFIEQFYDSIDQVISRDDVLRPFKNILLELKESLSDFSGGNANVEAAIRWSYRYDLLTQAYALADEYIISRVVEHVKVLIPRALSKQFHRDFVSAILSINDDRFQKPSGTVKTYYKEATRIRQLPLVQQLKDYASTVNWCRNELAHATGQIQYKTFINNFRCVKECLEILNSEAAQHPITEQMLTAQEAPCDTPQVETEATAAAPAAAPSNSEGPSADNAQAPSPQEQPASAPPKKLLINLSKPVSKTWDDRQRKAASRFADEIIDVNYKRPFWDSTDDEVKSLAQKCVDKILGMGDPQQITVHITGFDTAFIFHLVTLLKKKGVRCVTSVRNSDKLFIQFREY